MNKLLFAAAILSAVTAGIHFWAGGHDVVDPLLAARDLTEAAKFTAYYCWHMVSVLLVAMSIGFGYAALSAGGGRALAIALVALCAAFVLLSLWVGFVSGLGPWQLPQWVLFLPIGLLGCLGLRQGRDSRP